MAYSIRFLPSNQAIMVSGGTVLAAQIAAGLHPDAPCAGKGTCGKCRVVIDGIEALACQTMIDRDMTIWTEKPKHTQILSAGQEVWTQPDGISPYVLAIDIGTTTVVAYLLDGMTGRQITTESCVNPQGQFGADVISRIEYTLAEGSWPLQDSIRQALYKLAEAVAQKGGIAMTDIGTAAIAGNTAMHHLLLGINPRPLITPPYMPAVRDAIEYPGDCNVRILPNIAGYVGGDTVGCMAATRFDQLEELTLLIDIGTNGEMVLGNKHRRIACSTAAGPAFEGAKISCGMRGAVGAVDHVSLDDGKIFWHVIGDTAPQGLCGSGLLDLIAVLLDTGILEESGRLADQEYTLCEHVILTQKDVREVQLAKAAIRAGIELLASHLDTTVSEIQRVYLAGAFGSYMNPASACRIGMIPPVLQNRITAIGNAAGEGAKLCVLSRKEFEYSKKLAKETEFLELASLPEFQDCYVDALEFCEEDDE